MMKNENRPGYKTTRVGWIPEDWTASSIGKHIDLLVGFPFKSDSYTESEHSIRLLRGDNIAQGSLRWVNVKRWPQNDVDELAEYQLRSGDLVIAMDRTWIKAGLKVSRLTGEDLPCLLVQRVARLRAEPDLHPYYLVLLIRRHYFEQYVKAVQTETAVPHISSKQIGEFPIPFPPLPEQTAIAGVLECWDGAC